MTGNQGRLNGKVALITGAARGLGEQIALRFHDEGATPCSLSPQPPVQLRMGH